MLHRSAGDRYLGLFSASVLHRLNFMWQEHLVEVAKYVMGCYDHHNMMP